MVEERKPKEEEEKTVIGEDIRNNFIISCGISQLDEAKLGKDGLNVLNAAYRALDVFLKRDNPVDEKILTREDIQEQIARVTKAVCERFNARQDREAYLKALRKATTVPIGAEAITLAGWEEKHPEWKPEQDYYVLLASQTASGLFAREVLSGVLACCWQVPETSIKKMMVPELRAAPADVGKALVNFTQAVKDNLKPNKANDRWHNVLVATGGYKSVIICMTAVAFLYGIELIYMHEDSDELLPLYPQVELQSEKSRAFWKNTWAEMEKRGFADSAPEWFRLLLKNRQETLESFSG